MTKHSNVYYLFLEDQKKNPIDVAANERIRKNIEKFYWEIKPPWKSEPLRGVKDEKSKENEEGEKT